MEMDKEKPKEMEMTLPLQLSPGSKFGFLDNDNLSMKSDPAFNEFWTSSPDLTKYYVSLFDLSPSTSPEQEFIVKQKEGTTLTLYHSTLSDLKTILSSPMKKKIWINSQNTLLTSPLAQDFLFSPLFTPSVTHLTYGWTTVTSDQNKKMTPSVFSRLLSLLPNLEYLAFNFNFNMDLNDTGESVFLASTLKTLLSRPTTKITQTLRHLKTLRLNRPCNFIISLIEEILKAAPNLEFIYGFPTFQITKIGKLNEMYKESGGQKNLGQIIKSYTEPDGMDRAPFKANQTVLSLLRPLTSQSSLALEKLHIFFHFMPSQARYYSETHGDIKKLFSKLLQMSAESLRILEMQPLEYFRWMDFPQTMSNLHTLKFIPDSPCPELKEKTEKQKNKPMKFGNVSFVVMADTSEAELEQIRQNYIREKIAERKEDDARPFQATFNKYFAPGYDLSKAFPSLVNVKMHINIEEMTPQQQQPGPSKGRKRKVVAVKTPLEIFEDCFPTTHFNPNEPLVSVRHLKLSTFMASECVKRLGQVFPNLTTITLSMTVEELDKILPLCFTTWSRLEVICLKVDLCTWKYDRKLDTAITGMSTEKLPLFGLSEEENAKILKKFKPRPCISALKELRLVKLRFKNLKKEVDEKARLFSTVSSQYGFRLLKPGFTIHLDLESGNRLGPMNKQEAIGLLKDVGEFVTVQG